METERKKSPRKSNKRSNPFALNTFEKTKMNVTPIKTASSPVIIDKHDTKKINPFGEMRKATSKNIMKTNIVNVERGEFIPYTFDIPIIDLDMEKSYRWLSKNNSTGNETGSTTYDTSKSVVHMDENMQQFLKSFENCVVVEVLPEPEARILHSKSSEVRITGKENFKKFKKVDFFYNDYCHMYLYINFRCNHYIFKQLLFHVRRIPFVNVRIPWK